jgi:hypothetical protein
VLSGTAAEGELVSAVSAVLRTELCSCTPGILKSTVLSGTAAGGELVSAVSALLRTELCSCTPGILKSSVLSGIAAEGELMRAVPAVLGTVEPPPILLVYCRALCCQVLLLKESWCNVLL